MPDLPEGHEFPEAGTDIDELLGQGDISEGVGKPGNMKLKGKILPDTRYGINTETPHILMYFRLFVRELRDVEELVFRLPEDLASIVGKFRQGQFQMRIQHEHLENLSNTLDKSSDRISFSLIIAALLVASSLLVPQEGSVLGLISLQSLGLIGYVMAAVMGIWLMIAFLRSGRLS